MTGNPLPIVDTHQHLLDRTALTYRWADGLPQLAGQLGLEQYAAAAAGTGIRSSVFMETAPDDWRAEWEVARRASVRATSVIERFVMGYPLEQGGVEGYLDEIGDVRLVGVRRICHVAADDLSEAPAFVEGVRTLGKRGLTFDLCFAARQLERARRLAVACPGTRLVLDHCGQPPVGSESVDGWREGVRRLAELPHVYCKLSGLPSYCPPGGADAATLRPFVEHVIECFGPKRMVWGSDWPVIDLNSGLREWVALTLELLAGLSVVERSSILSETANEVYPIRHA